MATRKSHKRFKPGADCWFYTLIEGHYVVKHAVILIKEPRRWNDGSDFGDAYEYQTDDGEAESQYADFLFHTDEDAKHALVRKITDLLGNSRHRVNMHLREAFENQKEVEWLESELDNLSEKKEY